MSEKDWWHDYGPFNRWSECPSRPDPSEVLLFYLEKRGIGLEEHISYLIDLLDLQKSMVYNILKGEALDSISRCRLLVQSLKIHPPLLGVDANSTLLNVIPIGGESTVLTSTPMRKAIRS